MERGKFSVLWCTVLSVCLLVGLAAVAEAKSITIKYSDHDPPGGMRTDFIKNVWLPEITRQTGGQVKIQDFWGGALLGSKEIFKGISDGITEMGFLYPGHYPGQLAAFTIFKLFPRGPAKFENMVWFYRKVYAEIPEFNQELKKANQMTLLFTAGLPGAFTGKNPLPNLNAVKGDKWRAGDKWALRFLQNAGAVPVSVPWGDVYMALQTGTIDGCFTNYDGLHMMKFDEVAPNLLISKKLWYAMPFIHNVNLDFWNGLPPDVREGILKACDLAEKAFAKTYDASFDKIMAAQQAAGFKVTVMSDADVVQWENAAELGKLQEQWVQEAVAAGLKNAPAIMEKMRELHAQAMAREN
jgi:TRAP-type C4-dicarboxylate transport system substrate-binding protein